MWRTFKDRFRGALLGLACGDALGTTLEFKSPGTFKPIDDIIGGGPFGLKPGQWTDDTSMALCLAESLIECQEFNPKDQLQRYVQWWREGHLSSTGHCFDIGNATATALSRFQKTGDEYCGSTDPNTAGNGSIMRLAPVPMFFLADNDKVKHYSALSSRTTHAAQTCVDACTYFSLLIAGALYGVSKEELFMKDYNPLICELWGLKRHLCDEISSIVKGSFTEKEPPEIKGSGYVVDSLEAALWAFHKTDNFRDGALLAVNLGDDADTTGAVYGQLAGAFYGASNIPSEWLEKLALRDVIEGIADDLYAPFAREHDLHEEPLVLRPDMDEQEKAQVLGSAEVSQYRILVGGQGEPVTLTEMAIRRKKEELLQDGFNRQQVAEMQEEEEMRAARRLERQKEAEERKIQENEQ